MIIQNIGEKPLNKTSVPNSFKSFIKQMDQKESTQNVDAKNDQNNYFRAELSQKFEQLLTITEKKNRLTFDYRESLRFLTSNLYKNKFAN